MRPPLALVACALVAALGCQMDTGPRTRRPVSSTGLDPSISPGGYDAHEPDPNQIGPGGPDASAQAGSGPGPGTGGFAGGPPTAGFPGSAPDASAGGPAGSGGPGGNGGSGGIGGGAGSPVDAAGTGSPDAATGPGGSGGFRPDASVDAPIGSGGSGGARFDARPDTSSSGGAGGFRPDASVDRPIDAPRPPVDAPIDVRRDSGSGGAGGNGGTGGSAGSGGAGGSTGTGCDSPNLVWKTGRKTHYTSYPAPGSDECITYNGCMWAGQFSACSGVKSEAWVRSHNIVALFPNFNTYKLHDICIRSGSKTMIVTVYDTCGDSDCSGCCTRNKGTADALVDLESYTNARWGLPDGLLQWADLGPTKGSGCN